MNMSIRTKLSLWILGLLVASSAVMGGVLITRLKKPLEQEIRMRGITIARNLASASADALLLDDFLNLSAQTTAAMHDNQGVIYALVADKEGVIRAHSDIQANLTGKPYALPAGIIPLEEGDNWSLSRFFLEKGRPVLDVASKIKFRGRGDIFGAVHIALDEAVLAQAVSRARRDGVLAGLLSAAAGILAAFVLAAYLARPIKILEEGARALGRGNLSVRIPVTSHDELGRLAEAFNEMTQKLKEAQKTQIEKELLDRDIATANNFQQLLLPAELPPVKGYEIASHYQAARTVGGDYFDVIPRKDRVHLVVADVSGKGIPGLLGMTLARNAIRYAMSDESSPSDIIVKANDLIYPDMSRKMFITLFYAVLNPKARTLVCANGGHHPLWIYRKSSKSLERFEVKGTAMNVAQGRSYAVTIKEKKVSLKVGDVAFFYTDGVNEAMNKGKEEFGEDRLEKAFVKLAPGKPADLLKGLKEELDRFRKGAEPNDDVTMLVLKAV